MSYNGKCRDVEKFIKKEGFDRILKRSLPVLGTGGSPYSIMCFSNGASASDEYVYDNNGNLTKDSNKGITNIAYNVLNLPSTVTFSDGSTIVYTYAADGTKLRTVHTISGTTTQKDYCGNVVYENGVQKMLLTEEGYVDLSASTPAYYYYLKDHQGNNRVVLSSSGTVAETNHYYPFGGVFASTGNVQPYKYNGKELDTKKGLNWYDYGARHYDATLGRWLVVDPLAEKYYGLSPYIYCNNLPIRYINPTGEDWKDAWETFKRATTVNFSIGLQAGLKIGSVGVKANAGSYQLSNKNNPQITSGASVGLGIVDIGFFDNVYENPNKMEIKETGMSVRIPFIAEEKYIQKEYYNKKHQKLKTENIVEKELSTEFDVSASFVIGLDFSFNWDEFETIIDDLFK